MSESFEILVTEWEGGQVVAGEIGFKDGTLSFYATKGYQVLMENIMAGKTSVGERVFDPTKDPEAWLRSLPSFYTGSIIRARLGGILLNRKFALGGRSREPLLDLPPEALLGFGT